ncbi:MAG: NAD(P)/FAD-dependent oxidoreductase [Candidatus Abyssubacteria bacterium]
MSKAKVVILGGGMGGVYTALRLRSCWPLGQEWEITLISRGRHFEFKPLFPEVLAGRLDADSVRVPLPDLLGESHVKTATVTSIDPVSRIVQTEKGHVDFDYLVISLGGMRESVPTAGTVPLMSVESLDECLALRSKVCRLLSKGTTTRTRTRRNIVIIGAGPTGIEVACELRHLATRVGREKNLPPFDIHLVEASANILSRWGEALREDTENILKGSGIHLRIGSEVTRIEDGIVQIKGKRSIRADCVVWAGGLRGLELYRTLGAPLDEKDRLCVNPMLQLLNHENIYAIGDGIDTSVFDPPVPQSAQAAYQQSALVAANIRRSIGGLALRRFRYRELGYVLPVGGRRAVARMMGIPLNGRVAWALEKALFLVRIPKLSPRLRLLEGLAVSPLVRRGAEYIEGRCSREPFQYLKKTLLDPANHQGIDKPRTPR